MSYPQGVLTYEERSEWKWYHDLLYSSFSTFASETNYECGRDWRGGWWYPYGIKQDSDTYLIKEECQYTKLKPISNLNGMFNENEKDNERQLVVCLKEKVEDCIEMEKNEYDTIIGWHLKNTTTIKLTETKMWLKRSESEVGYEQILSPKEPQFANDGEYCWVNCNYKQGPCKWCGKEGMCCTQETVRRGFKNGCDGTFGGLTRFECVLKPKN